LKGAVLGKTSVLCIHKLKLFFLLFSLFASLLFFLIFSPASALAANVTLYWDPVPLATGYKLHYGFESNAYVHVIDVGPNVQHTFSDLDENQVYYCAVSAYNEFEESGLSEELVLAVETATTNNSPTVSITSPANGASFNTGAIIFFDGAATDNEDGDLTGGMIWTSDLQGQIATVGSFTTVLSDGTHTITAEVTDSGGSTASESTTITIGGGSDDSLTLSVNAYKVKGDKYAELTWSGANSDSVDVYRDGGSPITTTANVEAFTHGPFSKGKPATYQVCEAGTSTCSNEVTVSW
jgi:hypothetical protein